jgi:DNA-binding NarL/FixJ family response regulator
MSLDAVVPSVSASALPLRVGIVHGNRLSGELLRQMIGEWNYETVMLEHSVPEGVEQFARTRPDVIVIGHHPPLVDCLGFLSAAKRLGDAKVIICANRLTEYLVHKLVGLSFHAILEEPSSCVAELHDALVRVRSGSRHLCARFRQLAAELRENPDAFPKLLSPRQEQVLVCIAHELEDAEIGPRLGVSSATAQRHRTDIMRKLGHRRTPRVIRYAIQSGFNDAALP